MPSKAIVSYRRRFNILKKLPIFYRNGDLKLEKHPIWEKAQKLLNDDIGVHNLYISVLQNRNELLSDLKVKAGFLVHNQRKQSHSYENSSEQSDDTDGDEASSSADEFKTVESDITNKNPHNCPEYNFQIKLSAAEYSKVKPIDTFYNNNPYVVQRLNYGWTDVFVRKISSTTRLKCCFSFKKQTVFKNKNRPLFDFYGYCRVCKTQVYGYCSRKNLDETDTVVVHIKTFDTTAIPHKGKRFLKGAPLKKARKILKYVKASRFRTKMAKRLFKFGDPEPADLQTTINLRKARERAINEELDIQGPKDVYASLKYLANQPASQIRHLQSYRFTVIFQSNNQITVWKNLAAKGRLCVSIDASGTFVKPINILGHDTQYVLFYANITIVASKIVPLQQMISEKHDTNSIKKWLCDAIREGAPIPDEVTTDGCLALQGSVCLTYNKCSYREFLENGFQYCLNKRNGSLQKISLCKTWVRLDRAHLIKACARWTCWKTVNSSTKDIYLRIIGFCLEIEDLQSLEDVLYAIFVLSESKFIVPNTESQTQLTWMMEKIKTFDRSNVHKILGKSSEADSKELNFQSEDEYNQVVTHNNINDFIQHIYQRAVNNASTELTADAMSNGLQCPQIKNNIFYLFAQAPAWTNLLRKAHGSPNVKAVSAGSESYFKNLKALDWVTYPISANKFVKNQEEHIEAAVAIAQSHLMDETVEKEYEASQKSAKNGNVDKAIDKTNHERKHKHTQKSTIVETQNKSLKEDLIIRNGNTKTSPVTIEENDKRTLYTTTNTCPIDSLTEISSFSYREMQEFKSMMNSRNDDFAKAVVTYCQNKCCKTYYYQKRAELMKPIATEITKDLKTGVQNIASQYNVGDLFEKLFSSKYFINRTVSCTNCNFIRIDGYQTAILPMASLKNFRREGMSTLQDYINLHFEYGNLHCTRCKTNGRRNDYTIDTVLAINMEYLFLHHGKVSEPDKLPTMLKVKNKNYRVAGVVAFRDLQSKEVPLHYFVYLFHNNIWEKRDDMDNRIDTSPHLPRTIKISLAIYVVSSDEQS